MAFTWSRSLTEDLINLLQCNESLWNVRSPDYSNRHKRQQDLQSISDEIRNTTKTNFPSVQHVRDKIQSLRSQFRRELRAVVCSKKSGSGSSDIVTSSLWCYDLLDFLRPLVEIRETHSSFINSSFDPDKTLEEDEPSTSSSSSSPSSAKKQCSSKSKNFNISRSLDELKGIVLSNKVRRYEWVGEQVVSMLEDMKNEDIVMETINIINNTLFNARKKDKEMYAATNELQQSPNKFNDILNMALQDVLSDDDFD